MLDKKSVHRKTFKQEELILIKKLDLNETTVAMPENLFQLLIWTSDLAQHNHALFIQNKNELELVGENDQNKKQELTDKINFYKKNALIENQTKDFYLNKLLNQGDLAVKGYIQHPTRTQTKYAIIPYQGYDFITFATREIIEKFPIHFIDFKNEGAPQTLEDIHADTEELLSKVKDFVKSFREKYKEAVKKNKLIKEHNAAVHEIYIKIKNGEAKLIKDVAEEVPRVEETAPIQTVNSNEKPIKVIKKRKFALVKNE
ncbi:hypothetical protein ABSDF_p20008 (plasmid) [Acinetobacter baumannii SDF]|uniref:Uncharacterized protein n=1 Tax=Acinetobacter baumannii (strain SDF) TaxID=509170 RepID=B0VVC1_ACIBS|nr:hypothetical protein ABSDF_p20008 [Acinetobacter baumannii SDF]